ncbi:MAG: hypothetical protein P4L99_03975 [Chthoniobacter sp.]|nr:hypothetical protein [Chthoniobacter sp.]
MNRIALMLLLTLPWAFAPAHAAPKSTKKTVEPIPPPALSPDTPRLIDFEGDDLALALRTLARSARINLVISDDLPKDTVTMRLEDHTPRQAIDLIAGSKDLLVEDRKGILFVRPKNPLPKKPAQEGKELADELAPAITSFCDSLLDFMAKPETARKIAKAKKSLYDALVNEGFTKDEALRIILTTPEIPSLNTKQ